MSLQLCRRALAHAMVLCGLVLTGCGGGGGATDGGTVPVATGSATVLAGSLQGAGSADGVGLAAQFSSLNGIAQDRAGNTYVADGSALRKMTLDGTVTTLAGSLDQTGSADGIGTAARFNWLAGVALDASGNVYVTDIRNHTIRRITSTGVVTTLAGHAGEAGAADGPGDAARFSFPAGLAIDKQGNVYVADSANHTVRKITPQGVVSTFAGAAGQSGSVAGDGPAARFPCPKPWRWMVTAMCTWRSQKPGEWFASSVRPAMPCRGARRATAWCTMSAIPAPWRWTRRVTSTWRRVAPPFPPGTLDQQCSAPSSGLPQMARFRTWRETMYRVRMTARPRWRGSDCPEASPWVARVD